MYVCFGSVTCSSESRQKSLYHTLRLLRNTNKHCEQNLKDCIQLKLIRDIILRVRVVVIALKVPAHNYQLRALGCAVYPMYEQWGYAVCQGVVRFSWIHTVCSWLGYTTLKEWYDIGIVRYAMLWRCTVCSDGLGYTTLKEG